MFVIETDALDVGIGAVLMQEGHPLAYVSRSLGPRNRGLSVYEKEYMAILLAIQQWRSYVQFAEFLIQTDQQSLIHLSDQRLHTVWQQKAHTKLMGLQYRIVYKKGADNKAADALSRKPFDGQSVLATSLVQPLWLDEVASSYLADPFAQTLLQQLAVASDHTSGSFQLHNHLIRKKGRIWVAAVPSLQLKIIQAFHDSPLGGHSGAPVTYQRLKCLFAWTGLKKQVWQYVQACDICQRAKPERSPYPGKLQPLPIPQGAWELITMDFIEGLPTSFHYNCILVIVDKFSKYSHFIPVRHPYTAKKIAELFLHRYYKLHGMPQAIVSDRDPIFTSSFWQEFFLSYWH